MSAGATAGLGFQFAATFLVFAFAGVWLDRKLGTSPWLVIAMVFLGAGASFWSVFRRLPKPEGRGKREEGRES
jgi:ATP synthase protein I